MRDPVLAAAVRAGLLATLLCASCGSDVALDCSAVPMSCESGRYRVDGAGCILECLAAKESQPVCPTGPPMSCLYGAELDANQCVKGCTEPKGTPAGLCVVDGEPAACSAPPGQPARECMSDFLVCGPEMRCVPREKKLCDPRMPMCPVGLACRLADGCRPPLERCFGGYVTDPLGCVKGCKPPPPMGVPGCAEPVPACANNLFNVDDRGCIVGCRPPPTVMPPAICANLAERCAAGGDSPICRGCAFGYTLDERHCLGTMCLPDPGRCAPPPGRCQKGFSADARGCLSCRV